MSDPNYLGFVWNHVLRGARLVAVDPVQKGFVLTFRCPEPLGTALGSETLRLELHATAPLQVAWFGGEGATPLDTLLDRHALYVPPPTPELGLWLGSDPEGPGAVQLGYDGGLTTLSTTAGKRLSPMKAFSLGKASVLAQQGLVDTPVLIARRQEAMGAVVPLLRASGFRGSEAFSWRADPEVTQGVATVHSRWNTHLGLAFSFGFHVRRMPPPARAPRTALDLYAAAQPGAVFVRPGHTLRIPPEDYTVDQDTRPEALARVLVHDFEAYYMPFLEGVRDPEGVRETFGGEAVVKGR